MCRDAKKFVLTCTAYVFFSFVSHWPVYAFEVLDSPQTEFSENAIVILSDIHSNLSALVAAIEIVDGLGISRSRIISLGDMVGYGPNPLEVLSIARGLDGGEAFGKLLKGNHDYAAAHGDYSQLNWIASQSAEWTRELLSQPEHEFLASLPYVDEYDFGNGEKISLAHASLKHPEGHSNASYFYPGISYARYTEYNLPPLVDTKNRLLFVGHSHHPGINELTLKVDNNTSFDDQAKRDQSNYTHRTNLHDPESKTSILLGSQSFYFVNVGSIGQPRNETWGDA